MALEDKSTGLVSDGLGDRKRAIRFSTCARSTGSTGALCFLRLFS